MLKKFTLFFLWVTVPGFSQCFDGFQIGSYHVVSIKSDGSLWGWGSSDIGQLSNTNLVNPTLFQIGTATDWLKVSALFRNYWTKNICDFSLIRFFIRTCQSNK